MTSARAGDQKAEAASVRLALLIRCRMLSGGVILLHEAVVPRVGVAGFQRQAMGMR